MFATYKTTLPTVYRAFKRPTDESVPVATTDIDMYNHIDISDDESRSVTNNVPEFNVIMLVPLIVVIFMPYT